MLQVFPILLALLVAPPDESDFEVSAKMPENVSSGSFTVTVEIADGWSSSNAGLPKPLLQIEVPDNVELEGRELSTHRELAGNEFLRAPHERQIKSGSNQIKFSATRPGGEIRLRIVAYLKSDTDGSSHYVSRSLRLPVQGGAVGSGGGVTDAGWTWEGMLAKGDDASDFSLPRADGSLVSLSGFKGEKNVIVTTYRAFW